MRAHLYRVITDAEGDVQLGVVVRVLQPDIAPASSSPPVTAAIYAAKQGGATLGTTFTCANGVVDFWVDAPQYVMLGLTTTGKPEFFVDNVVISNMGAPIDEARISYDTDGNPYFEIANIGIDTDGNPYFADDISVDNRIPLRADTDGALYFL